MKMTTLGQKLTILPTVVSNPHKYLVPTSLPRDLAAAVTADLLLLKNNTYSSTLLLVQLVNDTLARVNGKDAA